MADHSHEDLEKRLRKVEQVQAVLSDRWGIITRFGIPLLAAIGGAIIARGA